MRRVNRRKIIEKNVLEGRVLSKSFYFDPKGIKLNEFISEMLFYCREGRMG